VRTAFPSHARIWIASAVALAACRGGSISSAPASGPTADPTTPPQASAVAIPGVGFARPLSGAARLGREIFFDKSLSASGTMSCATCHDPDHAYAPPNGLAVQPGGPRGEDRGTRAVPSLRYKHYTPAYADQLDNPDGVSAPGPGGGFTWDGRASSLAEQAKLPLLSPVEMANRDAADVARKVRAASYAPELAKTFAGLSLDDADAVFKAVLASLQAFQLEDRSFHPYTSKFDRHTDNKIGGTFTPAEERGLKLFVGEKTGNCAACHFLGAGRDGSISLFTDFSYEAIGVPRNAEIPANADAAYFDVGLCGPARADHVPGPAATNAFCGMFKTPTLRNVATRKAFFHNGVIHSLEQAVRFYATRDTRPELWYPTVGGRPKAHNDRSFPTYGLVTTQFVGGTVQKFDDLPALHRGNLDKQMPLDGRAPGAKPPLGERDVQDLVCFLETLDDGYEPPASPSTTGRCVE
jgi:cytochrome c peroxidase